MQTRTFRFANIAVLGLRVEATTPQRARESVGPHH
jgi:hypothetical protein